MKPDFTWYDVAALLGAHAMLEGDGWSPVAGLHYDIGHSNARHVDDAWLSLARRIAARLPDPPEWIQRDLEAANRWSDLRPIPTSAVATGPQVAAG